MVVHYRLHYFDLRGLGECIRLLFAYVGQPFEDVRIKQADWPDRKSKYFYGKVPVLYIDDDRWLAQSATILRYLGEKFGLAGKDEWERAKVSELLDFQKDVYAELAPYLYTKMGFREGDQDKLRVDSFEPGVARLFPLYESLLARSGSGFLLPSGPTIVDFLVADYLHSIKKLEASTIGDYPELISYVDKVYALPQLKEYLKKRPDTIF